MERSSPLAAMQPPSLLGPWGFRPDQSLGRSGFNDCNTIGPNSFNFRDLSMKRPAPDYFTLRPVRGSSPTASLAADLSQNFHIDKSPQLATPRRALFTSTLFGAINCRESMTTPPLPSSSPGPGNDPMDISPLPHKAPFSTATRMGLDSPMAQSSTADDVMTSPVQPASAPPCDQVKQDPVPERRRPPFARPSIARAKWNSTSAVSLKSTGLETQLPPFRFGLGGKPPAAPTMTLGECFAESPLRERKPSSVDATTSMMGPPRGKPSFASAINGVRSGSPAAGVCRKPPAPPAPAARPRKQFRRSLSMFEHPGDFMRDENGASCSGAALQSVMDVDESHKLLLPHFLPEDQPDSLPRITRDTLIDVLDGKYAAVYDGSVIVDCRFEYEYEGGHIDGALNFNDKEMLATKLFEVKTPPRTLLVFHCEYSAHRAPLMAKFIRGQDRAMNHHRYPDLSYPEVYILDGGYSSFFGTHRGRCVPQNYVEMHSKEHVSTCEREMGKLKHRKKLSRAQTFAFGQQDLHLDESPTGPSCSKDPDMMIGCGLPDELRRGQTRRMASF